MDAHAHADAHGHGHGHGHGGHGKDHVPHVLPVMTYVLTLASLLVLTAITVGVSYVNFGAANVWIALLVATIKASIVALIFMHLFFDQKFNAIILVMGLLFLGVFIVFTMFDTEARGYANDPFKGERPVDIKQPWAGTRTDERIKERWGKAEHKGEQADKRDEHSSKTEKAGHDERSGGTDPGSKGPEQKKDSAGPGVPDTHGTHEPAPQH